MSLTDVTDVQFASSYPIDKVVSAFEGNTTTHTVAAATLSGGLYIGETDTLTIPNPFGAKCTFTMAWSIDGTNFYPNKSRLYQPGNPVPSGIIGATVGMSVSADNIVFYFTHYYGTSVDFTIKWVLDYLDGVQGFFDPVAPANTDSGVLFTSNKNYMKRALADTETMTGPNVDYTFFFAKDLTITHSLGIVPFYRVFYEPFNDGKVFEAIQDSQYYLSDPINTYGGSADAPVCYTEATDTTLRISLGFIDGTLSGDSFPVHYVIYKDYGLA